MDKENQGDSLWRSDDDRRRQLVVDAVSSILYRDGAASSPARNHRDRLAAVAPQGKQKGIQLRVLGFNSRDGVLLSFFRFCQIHKSSPDSHFCLQLDAANRRAEK